MKKILVPLLFAGIVLQMGSCSQSKTPEPVKTDSVKEVSAATEATVTCREPVYPLFIENTTTNPQFQILMNDVLNRPFPDRRKNIVFQFYHATAGYLSLGVITGKRNRQGWDSTKMFTLTKCDKCSSPAICLDGGNFLLSDLEISNFNNKLIDKLVDSAADHANHAYVIFVPRDTTIIRSIKSIYFDIYFEKDNSDATFKRLLTSASNIQANPSPPHGGN